MVAEQALQERASNTVDTRDSAHATNAASKDSINDSNKRPHISITDGDGDGDDEESGKENHLLSRPSDGILDPKYNCNKLRTRIRALIDSGEVKVTHFQKELGINSNSYGRFMKLKGPWSGLDNQTFSAAYDYFKARDAAGVKAPAKKRKSNDGTAMTVKAGPPDVSHIKLDGEEEDKVEVYATPAEIRRKISAHMPREGVTAAAFCRVLGDQFHPPRKFSSEQLKRFRDKKGADTGNTSGIFYAAYCYFEKLRIHEGKGKGKFREEMEKIWGSEGGFDTERGGPSERGILLRAHETFTVDKYGQLQIHER